MNLYKVSVYLDDSIKNYFYVIAKSETEASELVMKKWKEWGYFSTAYVRKIELLAQQRQYGRPHTLIIVDGGK